MKQKNLVLMVVAVGCGLVAAFLTSQMSARSAGVEQVEVIVAAKDLPVGTLLTKDELKNAVKMKKVPKDGLPPAFVTDLNDLADKRLSRAVRMEETFNPADLSKGGVITLPPGMDMISLQIGASNSAAGFVGPGSRVDVLATARLRNQMIAFPLLVNMLVVAVDTQTTYSQNGTFPTLNTVSFAVDRKQALLLALAKSRGCTLELLLRHPEKNSKTDDHYKIEDVLKMLQDAGNSATIGGPQNESPVEPDGGIARGTPKTDTPKPEHGEKTEKAEQPAPKPETVRVLVAAEELPAGTTITKDLASKFKLVELPRGLADGAFPEISEELLGKVFTHGLGKGQWITGSLVGEPGLKPRPERDVFINPKDDPRVETPSPSIRRNTHDVTLHTPGGSKVFRYVEINAGEWRLLGEVSPTDRVPADKPEGRHEKKVD